MDNEKNNIESLDNILALKDSTFLKLFPGIENVVGFMASATDCYGCQGQEYPIFREIEIKRIEEYIDLLQKGHPRAGEIYSKVKNILRF